MKATTTKPPEFEWEASHCAPFSFPFLSFRFPSFRPSLLSARQRPGKEWPQVNSSLSLGSGLLLAHELTLTFNMAKSSSNTQLKCARKLHLSLLGSSMNHEWKKPSGCCGGGSRTSKSQFQSPDSWFLTLNSWFPIRAHDNTQLLLSLWSLNRALPAASILPVCLPVFSLAYLLNSLRDS